MQKPDIEKRIGEIEAMMGASDFWADKDRAQRFLAEYKSLKQQLEGAEGYDKGDAIISIL